MHRLGLSLILNFGMKKTLVFYLLKVLTQNPKSNIVTDKNPVREITIRSVHLFTSFQNFWS